MQGRRQSCTDSSAPRALCLLPSLVASLERLSGGRSFRARNRSPSTTRVRWLSSTFVATLLHETRRRLRRRPPFSLLHARTTRTILVRHPVPQRLRCASSPSISPLETDSKIWIIIRLRLHYTRVLRSSSLPAFHRSLVHLMYQLLRRPSVHMGSGCCIRRPVRCYVVWQSRFVPIPTLFAVVTWTFTPSPIST